MRIKVLETDEQFGRFLIEETTPAQVNAIRRTLLSDVPTMAIDTVEINQGIIRDDDGREYESIAPLFDEIIAHRLGLLPVPTDLDNYVFRDSCECGGVGCPHCTITYIINKKGPCTVYSGDLIPVGNDSSLKIVDGLIPIVELKEKQALIAYAIAELGTGREHAKWQPVSGLGYTYYPTIRIDMKRCSGKCKELVSSCPSKAKKTDGDIVTITKVDACYDLMKCIDICEEAVEVDYDESRIIMQYETDGSISAKDAIEYALLLLDENFRDLGDKVAIVDKIAKVRAPAAKEEVRKEEPKEGEEIKEENFG